MASSENSDWQLECSVIRERGARLLASEQWADCSFLLGAAAVPARAHRLILAMASPVFQAMFYGPVAEGDAPIPVPDIQPGAFNKLLQYVYTDEADLENYKIAFEVYYAAEKYMLPHLKTLCTAYLLDNLVPQNACGIYEFANFIGDTKLEYDSLKVIKYQTKLALAPDSSLEHLAPGTVVHIFSLDDLTIDSELDLLAAAERYVLAWQERVNEMADVNTSSSDVDSHNDSASNRIDKDANNVDIIKFNGLFGSSTQSTGLFGNTTATPAPAFGATTTGFGGFGASTSTGGGLFNSSTTGGGLFGATQNTSAFGAKPAGFGFGSATTTGTTGGGLFGASTATPNTGLFGQQSNTLGGGGLFSSNTGAFGAQQQPQSGTAHAKYNPVVGTDVVVRSGASQTINIKHHCITCMKEYEGKSLEELRLEDYTAGRKGPQAGGMFGGFTQQPQENKPLFGATSTFGAPATTTSSSVFGGGGITGGTAFGQTNSFSFGSNNQNTANTSGGLFGASKPAFGATTTPGTGLFGATTTQATPAFGSTATPSFGFGSNTQNQQTGGLFGAKPATSTFGGTGTTGFGGFGSTGGALFGANKPATAAPAFGTAAPAFGSLSGGFGTTTSTAGGGLFGGNNTLGKPATTQPTFGGFNTGTSGLAENQEITPSDTKPPQPACPEVVNRARSEATCRLTVNNVSKMEGAVYFPDIYVRNLLWKIRVEREPDNKNGHLDFSVLCVDGRNKPVSWSCKALIDIRLISHKPDTKPYCHNEKIYLCFSGRYYSFYEGYFMAWNDVLDPEKGYVKDDAITVEVRVVVEPPPLGLAWHSKDRIGSIDIKDDLVQAILREIRFLTLTAKELADYKPKLSLLTDQDIAAIIINIVSTETDKDMPRGFDTCRMPRDNLRSFP